MDDYLDIKIKQESLKPELKENTTSVLKQKLKEWQLESEEDKKNLDLLNKEYSSKFPLKIINSAK